VLGIAGAVGLAVSVMTLALVVYLAPPQSGPPAVKASRIEPEVATMDELLSVEGRVSELENATGSEDVQSNVEDVQSNVEEVNARVSDLQSTIDDLDSRISDLEFSVGAATGVDDLEARLSDLEGRVDAICIEASVGC